MSVVDYAITFCAAAPWVAGVIVGDAWPTLSDYCPLLLCLALPALPTPLVFSAPTLCTHWEPGMQAHWRVHLSSASFLACLQEATGLGDPQLEAAAVDVMLLGACQDVGLTQAPCLHNPNQDHKHHPAWFDDSCRVAQHVAWVATQEHSRYTTLALAAH